MYQHGQTPTTNNSNAYTAIDRYSGIKFFVPGYIARRVVLLALLANAGLASAADTQAPSVPRELKAVAASSTQLNLRWYASADNLGVTGYTIYLNDEYYKRTAGINTSIGGLQPGATYKVRVSAYDAAMNHSGWTATPVAVKLPGTTAAPTPPAGTTSFLCSFSSSPRECGFGEQSKVAGRATLTSVARDGGTAALLRTQPGDNNVFGSGVYERDDLSLTQSSTGCSQGQTQWWAHSMRFPNEYVVPPSGSVWNWGVVFNFHHTGPTGQANFQIVSLPTGLAFWVAGGATVVNGPSDPGHFAAPIGPVVKNTWYDFVYNVRWSSGSDGFIKGWVNGVLKLNYQGPTLYTGQGCYLKLANYHTALGVPVSIIHDRVVRGTSGAAVALQPLQ